MKKWTLPALSLSALLFGCGIAPDGSGSLVVNSVTTEYATSLNPNQYVGCDAIANSGTPSRSNKTQVVVNFSAAGTLTDVTVRLRGATSSAYDSFFEVTVPASQLTTTAAGSYRVVFDADSTAGRLLPSAITVVPREQEPLPVKLVSGTNQVSGGFYAEVTVNTATSTITQRSVGTIPVYRNCTLSQATPLSL